MNSNLQQRVADKVQESIKTVERYYNREFALPEISYTLRGVVAGNANSDCWRIKINPILLKENVDDMVNHTVPHEVAHLITNTVYGYGREVKSHGWQWKTVMKVLGVQPHRCHSYDTSNSRVKTNVKNKFLYTCSCEHEHIIGPVRNRKMQLRLQANRPSGYRCRTCKSSLVFVKALGQITYQEVREGKKPVKKQERRLNAPKKGSKMEQALQIYHRHETINRGTVIKLFMTMLGMSKAGATTYYYNCTKRV